MVFRDLGEEDQGEGGSPADPTPSLGGGGWTGTADFPTPSEPPPRLGGLSFSTSDSGASPLSGSRLSPAGAHGGGGRMFAQQPPPFSGREMTDWIWSGPRHHPKIFMSLYHIVHIYDTPIVIVPPNKSRHHWNVIPHRSAMVRERPPPPGSSSHRSPADRGPGHPEVSSRTLPFF